MRYVLARNSTENTQTSYRTYMTDIASAVASRLGISVSERWYDMISGETKEENPETIKQDILAEFRRLGGGE